MQNEKWFNYNREQQGCRVALKLLPGQKDGGIF